jgi:hydrogenase nickel incorporation protein HypB
VFAPTREVIIQQDILAGNNRIAARNRVFLQSRGLCCLNWISAPGSGKTALLERIIRHGGLQVPIAVVEGDQQTDADAARIRATGALAVQINTGAACHLDAEMVHRALHRMNPQGPGWLMIENVGNMVCPTAFDLGEDLKIAVISCPEGDDKPIKYPDLLVAAQVLLINKIDLLPYLDFDLAKCRAQAEQINPQLAVFPVSAKTGEGVPEFITWLTQQQVSS